MKLITETLDSDIQVITEAKQNGSKDYFIEGVFMMADMPNRNKRVYESRVLQPAVEKYIEQEYGLRFTGGVNIPEGQKSWNTWEETYDYIVVDESKFNNEYAWFVLKFKEE